jgi:SOS-response transcriptional repressor LexA
MNAKKLDVDLVERIRTYVLDNGAAPSYSQLARLAGFSSKAAAYKLARRLIEAGYLRVGIDRRLAPEKTLLGTNLVASVRAGSPETPTELQCERLTLEAYLIDAPATTVLVRVKGDSMTGAGILDGDLAVIDTAREARKGDFIVAMWNGETTLKELDFRSDGRPLLIPHNPAFRTICPDSLDSLGVYVGLVRRVRRK